MERVVLWPLYSLRIRTTLGSALVPSSLLAPLLNSTERTDFASWLSGSSFAAALTMGLKMSLTQSPKERERLASILSTTAFIARESAGRASSASWSSTKRQQLTNCTLISRKSSA